MASEPLNDHKRIHWVGGWVGLRAGLDILKKKNTLLLLGSNTDLPAKAIPVSNWSVNLLVTGNMVALTS